MSEDSKKRKPTHPKNYRNWKEYNGGACEKRRAPFRYRFFSWMAERTKVDERRKGGSSLRLSKLLFLNMLGAIHAYLLPYRQLEGFVRLLSRHVRELKGNVPDFTTIWWRVTTILVKLDPKVNLNEKITIAVDSTGMKVTNRGEWIKEKWLKERRGFIFQDTPSRWHGIKTNCFHESDSRKTRAMRR
jgi:hypothetical protein